MKRVFLNLVIITSVALGGCGEFIELQDSQQDDDRHLAEGFTPCGDFLGPNGGSVICNPNQYCADVTFSKCETGCLSEFNCTENQRCVKGSGEDIGYCEQLN